MKFPAYQALDKLTPEMRNRVENFLSAVAAARLHVIVTETWRSPERQEYLYSLGRTRPGNKVTWTMQSTHMIGEAVDVAFSKEDGEVTYEGDFEVLGRIGEANGLSWGGRWPVPDKPHFELNRNWQSSHWAAASEEKLLRLGVITTKKNLDQPPTRGELFVMLTKLHNL